MENQQFIDKINSLVASQSVLQHLALALFDAIENKTRVIQQFNETTVEAMSTSSKSVHSMRVMRDVRVPMRDGVRVAVDV